MTSIRNFTEKDMKIQYVRGLWGMEEPCLEDNLKKIKTGGYDHVEMGAPADPDMRDQLKELLQKYELGFVGQQWSGGKNIEEHIHSFEAQARANADMNPVLINSHSGRDIYSAQENIKLVQRGHELEKELNVTLLHEIHRGRMTFSSNSTMALLEIEPKMKFTADLSHWCCVHESLLQDQMDRVEKAMQNAYYIHARVGHEQGPQITHPHAPEWMNQVDAHFAWWDRIIELRKSEDTPLLTICPEFGPPGYMPTLPFTGQPVADLWEVNHSMLHKLKERYGSSQ